ncbi:MAG: hypothetical protein JXR76_03155 [Deltaproteobacteria bacterium]|nr:hypothetical protein [Deltaproteobacteria bacterium]
MVLRIPHILFFLLAAGYLVACQQTKFIAEELEHLTTEDSTALETGATDDSETASDSTLLSTDLDTDSVTETIPDSMSEMGSESDSMTDTETNTGDDSDSVSDSPDTDTRGVRPLEYNWQSSPELITPLIGELAIKDPSITFDEASHHWVIYTTAKQDPQALLRLAHLTIEKDPDFKDLDAISSTIKWQITVSPDSITYAAAPHIFKFSVDKKWYLVFQTPRPTYMTTDNPTDGQSWSDAKFFLNGNPVIDGVTINEPVDYWVICDDIFCHMFFSGHDGALYRMWTLKDNFPNGFGMNGEIVMQDADVNGLWDASNVYRLGDTGKYLLLVSAFQESGNRYFRSFTSDNLAGPWTEESVFTSADNVSGADWAIDGINHGDMLRKNPDETMTIDPWDMRYLFQGRRSQGAYDSSRFSLGLLTFTAP